MLCIPIPVFFFVWRVAALQFFQHSARSKLVVDLDLVSWPMTRKLRHQILGDQGYTTVTGQHLDFPGENEPCEIGETWWILS